MTEAPDVVVRSPLVLASLAALGDEATAPALEQRFRDIGADLQPGVAETLLAELASLGLARVGRPGEPRSYVPTTLGRRVVAGSLPGGAESLEELERLRTDLLSVVAHELRTPITVMRTLTGLLLDPSATPTETQRTEMLQTIERNAQRMQTQIEEILELARFRSGTIRLQTRPFDAVELATDAVESIRPLADERDQRLTVTVQRGGIPRVFGDHQRLDRALLNLLANAQRFSPDGGHIRVRVLVTPDGCVAWSVRDDGPGISAEDQAQLFERFFVGAATPRGRREGVGLGLPRALAIAQAHGGTIEVRSRVGAGSTFRLIVPAAGPVEAG